MGIEYLDEPPDFEIRGDLVYITDRSGEDKLVRCMSIRTFRRTHIKICRLLGKLDVEKAKVLPFKKAPGDH